MIHSGVSRVAEGEIHPGGTLRGVAKKEKRKKKKEEKGKK